jgi:hypothetical protein
MLVYGSSIMLEYKEILLQNPERKVDSMYGGKNFYKTCAGLQMKGRFVVAAVASLTVLMLSGCGMFFGSGDDPNGGGINDSGFDPETPVTEGNFSFTYHTGSTISFPEGELKVASSVYDGVKTTVRMRGLLRDDGKYAYNAVITFPGGDNAGNTFQVGEANVNGAITSYDGTTDGGMWTGDYATSPDTCTADDYTTINEGFISITGYGGLGERVVGSYDLFVANPFSCGSMKRFQGEFSVQRGS